MGLTILPDMPIPLSLARDWSTYRKNLDSTPLVDRYLANTLQQWVQNPQIPNPLVLPWIRILVDGSLNSLERHLADLEQSMGESALSKLLSDLLRKQGPAMDIQRDISALFGEIMAFRKLKEMGVRDITKIRSRGDWLADGVTVSVKTVLDVDHNYRQIEESLEGFAYLKEAPFMRSIRHIRVFDGKGLDNEFMSKTLKLIERSFEKILGFLLSDMGFPEWYYTMGEIEAIRIPEVADKSEIGRFHIKACRSDRATLSFEIEDIRAGESTESEGHTIRLSMKLRTDDPLAFSTNNDLNAWSGWPEVDQARLGNQILGKLEDIESKYDGDPTRFAAWINIETHPKFQPGVAGFPEKTQDYLARLVGNKEYPVFFLFYGGFELAKPLLLRFGGPTCFAEANGESSS
jgi:hypothetical protein